ncbi:MAG: ComEA family DNA-binding protein [Ramlibacter sp.]
MFKKLLAVVALLCATLSHAADVNKATEAELDGVRGIGPTMTKRILEERKKGEFKDWNDLIGRVQGIGPANATRFSKEGLTVKGEAFKAAAATPADQTPKGDKAEKSAGKKAETAKN